MKKVVFEYISVYTPKISGKNGTEEGESVIIKEGRILAKDANKALIVNCRCSGYSKELCK
jgi:hypothetical protein